MDLRREGLSRRKGLRSLRDGGRKENYPGKKCLWKIHPNKVTNWLVFFFIIVLFLFEEDANIWKARRPAEGARGQPEGTLR